MRLYRQHDLDLLYLYKTPNFCIQKSIRESIRDYVKNGCVNNGSYIVDVSNIKHNEVLPRSVQIHIYLSEDKDSQVISWLDNTSKGYRNSLIKNIYRNYINGPITYPYNPNKNEKSHTIVQPKANEDVRKLVNDILDAPLHSQADDVILKEGFTVLEKESTIKKAANARVDTNSNSNSIDGQFDIYNEFENIMKNF